MRSWAEKSALSHQVRATHSAHSNMQDVRKTVVASYPMVEPLLPDIIERTRDVSDVVRKLTYMALGAKLHVSKLT